jgi:hypothetical protein
VAILRVIGATFRMKVLLYVEFLGPLYILSTHCTTSSFTAPSIGSRNLSSEELTKIRPRLS